MKQGGTSLATDSHPTVAVRDTQTTMEDIKYYSGNGAVGRCTCCVLHKRILNKMQHIYFLARELHRSCNAVAVHIQ